MVDMKPRNVATAQMFYRQSTDSTITHYQYNQAHIMYNEPLVSYNYYSSRGNLTPRVIATPMMTSVDKSVGNRVSITARVLATTMMRGR